MNQNVFKRRAATWTASAVLRFIGTPSGERVARYVDTLNGLFHNDSGNISLNGEAWLLSRLGDAPSTVFDVGANRGTWTREALQRLPSATIHAFEPIPGTFAQLESSVGRGDRVLLNAMALSDNASTELRMWTDGGDGTMSSALAPVNASAQEVVVPCTSGDEYVSRNGVAHIDLLKIDVEGHEMEVLKGFEKSFSRGAVDLVQFEFTLWSAIAKRWLGDYYDFFSQWDFRIGKLWPRAIRWKGYGPEDERFFRCNFVAVRLGSGVAHRLGAE